MFGKLISSVTSNLFNSIGPAFDQTLQDYAAAFNSKYNLFGGSVPNQQDARDSSFQEFLAFSRKLQNNPSYTNMYSVHFLTPSMFGSQPGWSLSNNDEAFLLDYYCDSVSLPSKQMATGQLVTMGSPHRYITGTNFSQVSMTFKVPANHKTRTLFERWMAFTRNDADQYVDFYDNYCAPVVRIFKWERGGGNILSIFDKDRWASYVKKCGTGQGWLGMPQRNRIVAMWELRQVFPFNLGSTQLNNMESRVNTLTVGFYFERYRYYVPSYTDWGTHEAHIPGDHQHDPRKASVRTVKDRSKWITYNF
ncbi:MAG: hypothetical protein CMA50_03610 [Euryarchaeota archaeon]|jgi:hypothetical protein|nr:hypothetical protein [Euryarchaeota archaeon]|tara:strand:+ start:1167 stop:2084 length:918 start_codon:yes stop_codon:yes gene_type:complete